MEIILNIKHRFMLKNNLLNSVKENIIQSQVQGKNEEKENMLLVVYTI